MTNQRAKVAAIATVLGLGALGGVAMESNHGLPRATTAQVGGATKPIITSASGSATSAVQPAGVSRRAANHTPIVTRASGSTGAASFDD